MSSKFSLCLSSVLCLDQAYLNSDALSRFPEIELYEAVQAWLRHDRRRWRHTDTIVQSIRFCLMTPANIFEKVTSAFSSHVGSRGVNSVFTDVVFCPPLPRRR